MNNASALTSRWPVRITAGLLLLLGLYVLYFAWLGSFPLLDPDEPVYGQVAREMLAHGDWLTPHYHGVIWFDKPPLFDWLAATSMALFGVTEFAARFPSALLAVGVVWLVYALTAVDFGRRAGLLAAVVMATTLQTIVLSRASVTDMTLVFFLVAALYGYRRWLGSEGRARFGWAALCGAMTGLGMLTKGPVAPLLLSVTIAAHLLWLQQLRRLWSPDALVALLCVFAVGLPWYLAMLSLHHDQFIQDFLIANNVQRFTKAEHAGQTGKWFSYFINLPILFAFFFPWSMYLPQAFRRRVTVNAGSRLAFTWLAVVFVFFSLSKTILVTYIFPLFPAAALLVGALWQTGDDLELRGVRRGLWVGLGFSLLITAALYQFAHKEYPEAVAKTMVLGGILLLAHATALLLARRPDGLTPAFWALGAGMGLFCGWLMYDVIPMVGPQSSSAELVRALPQNAEIPVVAYGLLQKDKSVSRPSLLFYLNDRLSYTNDRDDVRRQWDRRAPMLVMCSKDGFNELALDGAIPRGQYKNIVVYANPAVPFTP